jgi:hypothetical protein
VEPLRRHQSQRRLVAVFRTEDEARAAAEDVRRMTGIAPTTVEIESGDDELAAMRAEMSEEMQHTIAAPGPFGGVTKEMQRGIVPGTLLAAVVGAVVALPLALVPFAGLDGGVRLLIAAGVGALAGALYGFFAGGAAKWETSVLDKDLAAERGVTLGVWTDEHHAEAVAFVLANHGPIRVDQVTPEGHALRTVATEDDLSE